MSKDIPKEALDITLATLQEHIFHYSACLQDISGRPEFDCVCPVGKITRKLSNMIKEDSK